MAGQCKRRGVALIVLAILMVIAAPMRARAQGTDDLYALHKQIATLLPQGKYAEATEIAKGSLALARRAEIRPLLLP
jgi:hypothetical protein